jgi:cytoskeletal protein RodZ
VGLSVAEVAVGHPWSVRRTALLIAGWGLATLFATILGLQAVSAISSSVTSSPRAPLSPDSVKAALDRPSSSESSSSSADEASSSSSDEGSSSQDDHGTPQSPASSSDGPGSSSAEASESQNSSVTAAAEDRTYELVGGSVGVRFENGEAHLLWATPNSGFNVDASGSDSNVDVRFESLNGSHESRLKAYWDNGPQQEIEEKD